MHFLRLILLVLCTTCLAQSRAQDLRTLRLGVNGDYACPPILQLGTTDRLELSFDDLTAEYRRYTYRLEHLEPNGELSDELFESEYVRTVAEEEVIEAYTPSLNTTVPYTHYTFTLPNAHVAPLISGIYRIIISTDDEEGDAMDVATALFAIVEPTGTKISATCSTDTDVDYAREHQQITLALTLPDNMPLRRADEELRVVVMQNQNLLTARTLPSPTSVSGQTARWEHCRSLIFPAGNEFRRFESLSTRYPGLHTDGVRWEEPFYVVSLQPDYLRPNYLYDEDHNGLSLVRTAGSGNPDVEADYILVRFTLQAEEPYANHTLYVDGNWAMPHLSDEYRMTYNARAGCYEADVLLKQGYYDYQYVALSSQDALSAKVEGNYFQTENEYQIYVFYRQPADRFSRLVLAQRLRYKQ